MNTLAILCNNVCVDGENMIEAKDSSGFRGVAKEKTESADRSWVKPTLERLSLKQAFTHPSGVPNDSCSAGS